MYIPIKHRNGHLVAFNVTLWEHTLCNLYVCVNTARLFALLIYFDFVSKVVAWQLTVISSTYLKIYNMHSLYKQNLYLDKQNNIIYVYKYTWRANIIRNKLCDLLVRKQLYQWNC